MKKVIVTGASGTVGEAVVSALRGDYQLTLLDLEQHADYNVDVVDISNWSALKAALNPADVLIHLAAIPEEDTPENILRNNIEGTLNIFEGARIHDIKRIVYASSVMTYWGYGEETPKQPLSPILHNWPTTQYAVSKLYGEYLGRVYAENHAISVICIRLGWYPRQPVDLKYFENHLYNLISVEDCKRLFARCVSVKDVDYAIVNGFSEGAKNHYDLECTRDLIGFYPSDDSFETGRQHANRLGLSFTK